MPLTGTLDDHMDALYNYIEVSANLEHKYGQLEFMDGWSENHIDQAYDDLEENDNNPLYLPFFHFTEPDGDTRDVLEQHHDKREITDLYPDYLKRVHNKLWDTAGDNFYHDRLESIGFQGIDDLYERISDSASGMAQMDGGHAYWRPDNYKHPFDHPNREELQQELVEMERIEEDEDGNVVWNERAEDADEDDPYYDEDISKSLMSRQYDARNVFGFRTSDAEIEEFETSILQLQQEQSVELKKFMEQFHTDNTGDEPVVRQPPQPMPEPINPQARRAMRDRPKFDRQAVVKKFIQKRRNE